MNYRHGYVTFACVFVTLLSGCGPVDSYAGSSSSSSSSGTGGGEPVNTFRAIDAFQEMRKAPRQDPDFDAVIDAQTATAAGADMSPGVEARRMAYVLDWMIDGPAQTWGQVANVTFERGGAPRTMEQANATAAAFAEAAATAAAKLPVLTWDAEWQSLTTDMLAAQAYSPRPVEWAKTSTSVLHGALDCAKIVAFHGAAESMSEAIAANGGVVHLLHKLENGAFDDIAAMTSER